MSAWLRIRAGVKISKTPPELQVVLFVPELRIATEDARAVLPSHISVADAVHNTSRIALLVAGLATNHPEYLRLATEDRLHQPYRQTLFPAGLWRPWCGGVGCR